jgi:DNA-binding beta-propeller fold protein YncE
MRHSVLYGALRMRVDEPRSGAASWAARARRVFRVAAARSAVASAVLAVLVVVAPVPAVAQTKMAPRFEVDPLWPQPLPNHWVIGSAVGVSVDARGHVWMIHRPSSLSVREIGAGSATAAGGCCTAAPDVLEFDAEGRLVGSWGGPGDGYEWPESSHGITVDHEDHVWIGGNGDNDAHLLKFTRSGEFLLQLGRLGGNAGSNDRENYGQPAKIAIDAAANEAYIADGYGNRRVAVIDTSTGELKRYWGAYGNRPDDADLGRYDPNASPSQQFSNPVHCAMPTRDGLVYVCDRVNDRIQVFEKSGKFVSELRVAPETTSGGSVWDIAFSSDPEQAFIYLADGSNEKVWIIERKSMQILTSFGDGGRQPGQFFGVHSIATDAAGNIYTTETFEGKRIQKFAYRGLAPVTTESQGTVWPAR